MLRSLVILGALAFCAFVAGWFTIDRNEKETTIRFNRDEIRADTNRAIEKGKELLEAHQNSAEESFEEPAPAYPSELNPQTGQLDFQPNDYQATRPIPPWELPQYGTPSNAQQY
ncbi:hypothetical protein LOC67_13865 [Stieleria sp. JC731]|uniref:hypothetical protein n=1 Tax=Pirellulaceae TaxID=2691357 RepID=UPI001E52CEA1|nr:hypothetical protein [Stieleria sp. JC731]MCC9601640.1 hypothetical protein [Stieleria sp. JC731]